MKRGVLFLVVLAMLLTACYWNASVASNEVGIISDDGQGISEIVGSGRYSDLLTWYAEVYVIDVSTKIVTWSDPSLITLDNQPIGASANLSYNRCRDKESIEIMFNDYRLQAFDDAALQALVLSRVPSQAKGVTSQSTLGELLGTETSRDVADSRLFNVLAPILKRDGICLTAAEFADIQVAESFEAQLERKAVEKSEQEVQQMRKSRLDTELEAEKAQTQIELEQARRQNEVNSELAKSYGENPELVEIRKLELLADVLADQDLVIYVPEGSDITSVLVGGDTPIVPTD